MYNPKKRPLATTKVAAAKVIDSPVMDVYNTQDEIYAIKPINKNPC